MSQRVMKPTAPAGITRWQHQRQVIRKSRQLYLMLMPYMLFFALFTVIPVFMSIYFSFTRFDLLQPAQFAGFSNYMRLFLDDPSMVRRLARASGVNLRPALERLLESTQG